MTLLTLKTKLRLANTSSDVELQTYIDFIYPYLSEILGVDLLKIGTITDKIFRNSYLGSKRIPIESWKVISKVEIAQKSQTLSWSELFEYRDFEFTRSTSHNSLIAVEGYFKNQIIRITGTYGFADTNGLDIPILIDAFILEGARQYLNFIKQKGKTINSESSGNLSISFGTSDVLTGLKVLDPANNSNLFNLIKKYQTKLFYPYL